MKKIGETEILRRLGVFALVAMAGTAAALAGSDPTNPPAVAGAATNHAVTAAADTNLFDLITLSSNKYEKCRITKVDPSAITVLHSKGIARIPFSDLPEEWQQKYNYDP